MKTRTTRHWIWVGLFALLVLAGAGEARAEDIYHWVLPSDQESPMYGPRLHSGDCYVVPEAHGVATFAKGGSPWWKKFIVEPLFHGAKIVSNAYCKSPACGAVIQLAKQFVPGGSDKKPRPVNNVPVDPHRKEGGVFTIDPDGDRVWVYQHLEANARDRCFISNAGGTLRLFVHDQGGKYGDNRGAYYGAIQVYHNHGN